MKKYYLSQKDMDELNQKFFDLQAENELLKKYKENDELLYSYEQEVIELRKYKEDAEIHLAKLREDARRTAHTLKLVLQKLESTASLVDHSNQKLRLYKEMDAFDTMNVRYHLNIFKDK